MQPEASPTEMRKIQTFNVDEAKYSCMIPCLQYADNAILPLLSPALKTKLCVTTYALM